ncbi:uncharacterized protein H6S33_002419 [Morchella sextelata]|uniref:uncharacterized protein n=1 Tax=Morchella sextelata TaxID=1174677 RepID=UPI001D045B7A|nr:uncharacterized protein H6S33_002419 [Morchella sextelata]KAH0607385.1 hypothetical protein H6S33_002419 [Morchella sextelata]
MQCPTPRPQNQIITEILKLLQAHYHTVFLRFCQLIATDKVPGPDPQMCVAASITAKAKRPLYESENEGFALLGGEGVVWAVREAQLVALDREMDVVEEEMRVVREGREGIWDVGE